MVVCDQRLKKNKLRMMFCSPFVSKKENDRSIWVGKFEYEGSMGPAWLQPYVQVPDSKNEVEFICPAWLVETTKDVAKVNMKIEWEVKSDGVHIPKLVNTEDLEKGTRLFRLAEPQGAMPEDARKALTRDRKRAKKKIEEAEAAARAEEEIGTGEGKGNASAKKKAKTE